MGGSLIVNRTGTGQIGGAWVDIEGELALGSGFGGLAAQIHTPGQERQ